MKNIKALELERYSDATRFEKITDVIHRDRASGTYRFAVSCELEPGEDTQYPLEDLLDRYLLNCTDFQEEQRLGDTVMFAFELEGESLGQVSEASQIIGRRVCNVKGEGGGVVLLIE